MSSPFADAGLNLAGTAVLSPAAEADIVIAPVPTAAASKSWQ